jgi:hypothetical protein
MGSKQLLGLWGKADTGLPFTPVLFATVVMKGQHAVSFATPTGCKSCNG